MDLLWLLPISIPFIFAYPFYLLVKSSQERVQQLERKTDRMRKTNLGMLKIPLIEYDHLTGEELKRFYDSKFHLITEETNGCDKS